MQVKIDFPTQDMAFVVQWLVYGGKSSCPASAESMLIDDGVSRKYLYAYVVASFQLSQHSS